MKKKETRNQKRERKGPKVKLPKNILIGIPVYNECEYIEDILSNVHKYAQNILIVDDGSTDGTKQRLSRFPTTHKITHEVNMGYGQSLIDIFQYAQKYQYQWVITMDCDHQHQPSCLIKFYNRIKKNNADIISGSRYLEVNSSMEDIPIERLKINRCITALLNQELHLQLTDAFCGFKAYRVESLKRLKLSEIGYGLPLELWIQAAKQQLSIQEIAVPLIYHDPNRNFAGDLESPGIRLNYYLSIIEHNFTLHGYKNTNPISCS